MINHQRNPRVSQMAFTDLSSSNNSPKLKKSYSYQITILISILIISGCASHYTPDAIYDPYGFFWGIWHGFIFPFSLAANIISWVLSLFDIHVFEDIQIIGRPNTGLFYYLGFILGLSSGSGGVSTVSR